MPPGERQFIEPLKRNASVVIRDQSQGLGQARPVGLAWFWQGLSETRTLSWLARHVVLNAANKRTVPF